MHLSSTNIDINIDNFGYMNEYTQFISSSQFHMNEIHKVIYENLFLEEIIFKVSLLEVIFFPRRNPYLWFSTVLLTV